MAALADAKGDGLKPLDVAALTGLSHTNARQLLFRMAREGEILKIGHGHYYHPSFPPPVTPVTTRVTSAKRKSSPSKTLVTPFTLSGKQNKTGDLDCDTDRDMDCDSDSQGGLGGVESGNVTSVRGHKAYLTPEQQAAVERAFAMQETTGSPILGLPGDSLDDL
jgi:hypothetical protein